MSPIPITRIRRRAAAALLAGIGLVLVSSPAVCEAVDAPLEVGGDVQAPQLLRKVEPDYPEEARHAHIVGNVLLEAIIDTEGRVTDLRIARSIPLLDEAALDAARQWRYKPATRAGQPVKVHFGIAVSFPPEPAASFPPKPVTKSALTPGAAADQPLEVVGDVRPPELVKKVSPEYPEEARRAKVGGRVIVQAIIDEDGNVASVAVTRSDPMLDDAAVAAVKQWKYKPATKEGKPVRVRFTVVVDFTYR